MRKIIAFAVRDDEMEAFEKYSKLYNFEVTYVKESLNPNTVEKCMNGFEGVSFLGNCNVNREVLEKLKSCGIKYIASRSTGYDNIDLESAKELGLKVSNSMYSSYSVADFTLMAGIMLLRNIPTTLKNISNSNFSLKGLIGREIREQTIGVIGTGKIGKIVATYFKNMGAKVIAYDLFPSCNDIEYVRLEELLSCSDIITLHTPLTENNYHLVNKERIKLMKDGCLIINTSRGELIDLEALIEGIKSSKIGGVALDTFEGEKGIVHRDCTLSGYNHTQLKELLGLKNVIITSHQAFYTTKAVSDMVESSLSCLNEFLTTGTSKNILY